MASSGHIPPHDQNNNQLHNVNYISSCSSPSYNISNSDSNFTTFVQADPSNFRSVVQKLTGAASASRHPVVGKSNSGEKGPRRPTFKLHERRHSARKLENILTGKILSPPPSNRQMVMASPVSPLEMLTRGSPKSPMEELEERAIADKGFYLHPSPLTTPRGTEPPQLLPLFPLQSPTARDHSSS
ncbi:PREDICTED: VQ motif-containing protein 11-like [Nicotiana attenuata]|uniref:Vq motif-containing protein 11 n=1 Tax=Nicotiana attenuata TaxID=49451 RepID=A0A314KSJ0_NICAT|nr:PREDICTED: VQ motif-containing protein 11-like [Nicotiana attenuata]OIT31679.1 vq motif-containing protein 11 [Nicotiana attenuata]